MRKILLNFLIFPMIALCAFSMIFFIHSSAYADATVKSWWTYVFAFDDAERQERLEKISERINENLGLGPDASFLKRVGRIRKFVSNNSENIIDDEFYSYWADMPGMLEMLEAHSKDPDKPMPHMECSTQTVAMYNLLKETGIDSRIIVVHPDKNPKISHTFLEIYDPQTKSWSIQDPFMNVFWKFKKSGKRASTEDLLSYPMKETFVPCYAKDSCKWTQKTENMINYFTLAEIIDISATYHPIMVNPDRFDTTKLQDFFYTEERSYCAIMLNGCSPDAQIVPSRTAP